MTKRHADDDAAARILARRRRALEKRADWESLWQDCYDYALPNARPFSGTVAAGARRGDRIFDGSAPDGVDQLAASLLAQLTPPWSRWFGFAPGPELTAEERDRVAPMLERAAEIAQGHFDRANFAVEIHQAFLDLATVGTACLLMEEAPPGAASAFRFAAVPLADVALEEGPEGRLDVAFRRVDLTLAELRARFPAARLPARLTAQTKDAPDARFAVVEAALPADAGCEWSMVLADDDGAPQILASAQVPRSPYIGFRWLKAPGEVYGRSPVMKALPDIKTANKVVELVLKNASIAVTGIWQADDDGVLNPAAVRLAPGTIIPKAVGSAGLTPLAAPGRFDVSQLVLDDLRARIRHALLADKLAPIADARMTATEVLERSGEAARLLGATYGRLQNELLTPLIEHAVHILRRRGEIPDIVVDNRMVTLQHRSPLALAQGQRDVQATLRWIEAAQALGPEALATVDAAAAARRLADAFGVPPALVKNVEPSPEPPPEPPPEPLQTPPSAWASAPQIPPVEAPRAAV